MCAWADHPSRQLQRSPAGHEQVMTQRPISRGEAAQGSDLPHSGSTTRHIPVATLPTKPINRCPMAAAAATAASATSVTSTPAAASTATSTVTSGAELIATSTPYQQPLNLSKRPQAVIIQNGLNSQHSTESVAAVVTTESSIPTKA